MTLQEVCMMGREKQHWTACVHKLTAASQLQVIDAIAKEKQLEQPSISYGAENLYMHGPLEELTKGNLSKVS